MSLKRCPKCGETKSVSEFGKNSRKRDGLQGHCRKCRSEYQKRWYADDPSIQRQRVRNRNPETKTSARLMATYGITLDQKREMVRNQGGRCAICLDELKEFNVDHCHKTGKVRGILCRKCNMGLGHFDDDAEVLRRAIEYLADDDDAV